MDNWIDRLEKITYHTVNQVEAMTYEEFEQFVGNRQVIIDELETILNVRKADDQQKQRLNQILRHDSLILNKMNVLKQEAYSKIQQRNQAKVQRNAYETAYVPDAFLMDSRK